MDKNKLPRNGAKAPPPAAAPPPPSASTNANDGDGMTDVPAGECNSDSFVVQDLDASSELNSSVDLGSATNKEAAPSDANDADDSAGAAAQESSEAADPSAAEEHSETMGQRDSITSTSSNVDDPIERYADRENLFFKSMQSGFTQIRERRESRRRPMLATSSTGSMASDDSLGTPDMSDASAATSSKPSHAFDACATVNFIDPTTLPDQPSAAPASKGPGKTNFLSRAAASIATEKKPGIQNVFEKLTHVFERDYGSKLRSVPYKSLRGGGNDTIATLPVRSVLTRSHQTSARGGNANVPWGGTAGKAAAVLSEPSEWHNAPFCHVFIAAIDTSDHYRSKVRPSLQAFVSQIESAATNAHPETLGANSAHYLIVYVPTGSKTDSHISTSGPNSGGISASDSNSPPPSSGTGAVRNALANRLQKARQRFTRSASSDDLSNDSLHSTDTLGSADMAGLGAIDPDDLESGRAALNLLTKSERRIYAKIATDFPTGKICALSRSSLEVSNDVSVTSSDVAARSHEWNCFNRMLGIVIVNGFRDRCRRYTDELRRLDAQRAATPRGPTVDPKTGRRRSSNTDSMVEFNVCYFFLVKESLAFTFEQMQLPAEALLQYDELKIYLPDIGPDRVRKRHRSRRDSANETSGKTGNNSPRDPVPLIDLADSGDYLGFRRRIRSERDLEPIADVVRRYLFAREISLLFEMDQPASLVRRCRDFIETMYIIMMRGVDDLSEDDAKVRKFEAAKWVVKFAWDVKCSADCLLASLGSASGKDKNSDTISVDTPASSLFFNAGLENSQSEQFVAKQLADLLEMARMFLRQIGDHQFGDNNPMRIELENPADMTITWSTWKAPSKSEDAGAQDNAASSDFEQELFVTNKYRIANDGPLDDTLETMDGFETKFVELTAAVVTLSKFSGRKRSASRLQGEMAEYYIQQGKLTHAAAIIKSMVKQYRADQWDRAHFWRLFRLAYCQRTTAESTDYLKTLVTCFSPRSLAVAPKPLLRYLQDDLGLVVADPLVGEARYGKLAFIDMRTEMAGVEDTAVLEVAGERKKLNKTSCTVGESIRLSVSVKSHLPGPIELDSLKLFVVSFSSFTTIAENHDAIEEEDAFRILSYTPPIADNGAIVLNPGTSQFEFEWFPMSSGQYLVSTTELKWREGFFYYDNMELGQPLLGVDVMPCDATHTLQVEPSRLIPGHEQKLKLRFMSMADFVKGGRLEIVCPPGFVVEADGEEAKKADGDDTNDSVAQKWNTRCEFKLPECDPDQERMFTANLRPATASGNQTAENQDKQSASEQSVSSEDTVTGLRAKAFVHFFHSKYDKKLDARCVPLKMATDSIVEVLSKPALTPTRVVSRWFPRGDRAMVSIGVCCNLPTPCIIDSWKLQLPPPLKIDASSKTDWNAGLLNLALHLDEQVHFSFQCIPDLQSLADSTGPSSPNGNGDTREDKGTPSLIVHLRDGTGKPFPVNIDLNLHGIYSKFSRQAHGTIESPLVPTSIELRITEEEAMVGQPIRMQFRILEPARSSADAIKFAISGGQDSCWMIAGRIGGMLGQAKTLDVIGIPTVAGTTTKFPTIRLLVDGDEPRDVPIHCKYPSQFKVLPITQHVSVASALRAN